MSDSVDFLGNPIQQDQPLDPAPQSAEEQSPAPETAPPAEQDLGENQPDASDDGAPEEPKQSHQVPLSALEDERKKRQELQQQNQQLQTDLAYHRNQTGKSAPERPSEPTEEEIANEFWTNPIKVIKRISGQTREETLGQVRMQIFNQSKARAKSQYDDYDAMEEKFATALDQQPWLREQMQSHYDPAQFIYQWAKSQQAPAESLEQMEARLRAEITADLQKQAVLQAANSTPKSQAGARGTGNDTAAAEPEQKSRMAKIFPNFA